VTTRREWWPPWLTWRIGFPAVVAVGAVVRLTTLASKWDLRLRLNDSLWYHGTAVDLANGVFFRNLVTQEATAEHPPLTSIVLAPASLFGDGVLGQRITTTLLGITTVAVVALVGRRIGGNRVGIVAGLIAALYPNMWLSDGLVMSESLAILLVSSFLLLALDVVPRPTAGRAALLGGLIGAAALTRSELLLLAPLTGLLLVWHHRRAALRPLATLLVAVVAVLAPWFIVNQSRFERPVVLTTNDGTTLLGANCDDVYSGGNIGGWSVFCVLDLDLRGDDSERSAQQRRLAVDYVRANVHRVPAVVTARVGRALDVYGLTDMVNGAVGEERPRAGVWAGIVGFWILAPLAALGLIRRVRGVPRQVLMMPVLIVLAITVMFYGGHRLRAPVEPVICLAAAAFLAGRSADARRNHAGDAVEAGGGERPVTAADHHEIVG
jgi:4-amino-4-deoxy-L-arabinose transferase-like glycosyltransferase